MIVLTLPYPVSANRYWRTFLPKGHSRPVTIPSDEAKAYRESVKWEASRRGISTPIMGRVRIGIELFPKRPQDWAKRAAKDPQTWDDTVQCVDLDNANKVLLDALKGVAIEDDKWVRELHAVRREPDGDARVVVTITQLAVPYSPQASLLEVST